MEKLIKTGGQARRWANPTNSELWRIFERLIPECEPSQYPGVLILTNAGHTSATLVQVKNLQRELPALQQQHPELTVAYWRTIAKPEEGAAYLSQLTDHPVFDDRI